MNKKVLKISVFSNGVEKGLMQGYMLPRDNSLDSVVVPAGSTPELIPETSSDRNPTSVSPGKSE